LQQKERHLRQHAHTIQEQSNPSFARRAYNTSQWTYAQRLAHGLETVWTDSRPLFIQPVTFQPDDVKPSMADVTEFLSRRLLDTPFDTDRLSPYLSMSQLVRVVRPIVQFSHSFAGWNIFSAFFFY
jgi:hypothetical protein